jgi:type I restriction enzyme S subunit
MAGKYQAYNDYKGSGVKWLGAIPLNWEVSKLKYTASIFGRIGFRGYTVDDIVNEGEGAIVLSPSNIDEDRFTLEKKSYLSWGKYYESPEIMVSNGDVLIVKTGSTFGKSTIVKCVEQPLTINPQMALIKDSNLDSRFLKYLLNSSLIKAIIDVSNTGSGMPTMTQENMNGFPIPRPSDEQATHIANFLDHETAKEDTLIKKQMQLIKLLRERRQAVISHAVTKGLNPSAPMRDSGVAWLGEVPVSWRIFPSKRLFPESKTRAPVSDMQLSATQDYGVISQEKFMLLAERRVVQLNSNQELRKKVNIGDFVISMRSFQGGLERAWDEGGIRSSYVVLKPVKSVDRDYYQYLFKSVRYIQALQSTANFIRDGQDMSYQNFILIDLPLPSPEEQKEVAAFLGNEISRIDQLIDKAEMLISLMQERRTALISAAVTGKIDVRSWQAPKPSSQGAING